MSTTQHARSQPYAPSQPYTPRQQYAPLVPPSGSPRSGGIAALFRADLGNYCRRWSTWLPLVLALLFGGLLAVSSLRPSRSTGGVNALDVTSQLGSLTLMITAGTGFLAGAAWMGFEHSSGSLGTWLTFNPRRTRVWLSRLAVAVLVPTSLGLLGLLITAIPAMGSAAASEFWGLTFIPYLTVVATLSALGFAVASIGRHVLWALGAFVGFVAVSSLSEEGSHGGEGPYLLHSALVDLLEGGPTAHDPYYQPETVLGMAPHLGGGVIWVTFTVLVVALGLVIFRRSSID